jgi:hypothetical protein
MRRTLKLLSLSLALAAAPLAGAAPATHSAPLAVPPKALLIGQGQLDQVRELPELQEARGDKIVREVGVAATDRLYESDRSYADTVKFFEHEIDRLNGTILKKNITSTSTAWTVRRPNGKLLDVVVRNTVPPTFEVVEGVEETK